MPHQEKTSESNPGGHIVPCRSLLPELPGKKCRQRQQPVLPPLAGAPRHGTPGFRRHIDEIDLLASGGATREVETKTELRQKPQLEARHACSRTPGLEE